jgi:hypothetical protein
MIFRLLKSARPGVTEERLSAYVDGALEAPERARLEALVSGSPAFRARQAGLVATVEALRSADPVRAPRSFALTPAMAYGPARPIPRRGVSPLVPAVAAAAAALAVGVLLIGNATGSLRQSARPAVPAATSAELALGPTPAAGVTGAEFPSAPKRVAGAPETGAEAPAAPTVADGAFGIAAAGEAGDLKAEAMPGEGADPPQATSAPVEAAATEPVTVVAAPELPPAPAEPPGPKVPPATGEAGERRGVVELPLWQLEIALGVLAIALAGLAAIAAMRRRRSVRLP